MASNLDRSIKIDIITPPKRERSSGVYKIVHACCIQFILSPTPLQWVLRYEYCFYVLKITPLTFDPSLFGEVEVANHHY